MWILNDIRDSCDSKANHRYYSIFSEKPIIKKDTNGVYVANFHDNYLGCIEECLLPKLNYLETAEINICIKGDINILSNYTNDELNTELYKRKLARREERSNIPRCRNCKHFRINSTTGDRGQCLMQEKRYKTGIRYYKVVIKYTKACDKYEKNYLITK